MVPFYYGEGGGGLDPLPTCLIDSKCSKDNQKKAALLLKKPSTKTAFDLGCKKQDDSYLGSRLKVTNASGATAGLGNLTSVKSANIHWELNTDNTPDWDGDGITHMNQQKMILITLRMAMSMFHLLLIAFIPAELL